MAEIYPPFENINRLKVKPTAGELFLLKYLVDNLPADYEVYFQPFLNGDMPDIVVLRKNAGVIIIEVKDWNFNSYYIDSENKWYSVTSNNHSIKSPFQQVFGYKSNMFNLHINGLAEKNVMDKHFYNIIKPFVYFHFASEEELKKIYIKAELELKTNRDDLNQKYRNKVIENSSYNKSMDYWSHKAKQINRDKGLSLYGNKITKLLTSLTSSQDLFTDEIYKEFKRYLKPPFHVASQGKDIIYDKKQTRLIKSGSGFQKIKGIAGSGKTTILAKRAVNAHKRHDEHVLILTYNKTLRNFIKDKISEVREDFSWGMFAITNYHSFITQILNECSFEISPPENKKAKAEYFDKLYSDENLFDDHIDKIKKKYQTILIDEVQDYQSAWIKIIKKYFLLPDGEMVLFGDDSQNIYKRNVSKKKPAIVQGFGSWERLSKSYRSKLDSPIISMTQKFQQDFLAEKYDMDLVELTPTQGVLPSFCILDSYSFSDMEDVKKIFKIIIHYIKEYVIHSNDVCIVSTNLPILRKLDMTIRSEMNEKTQTTFEEEEIFIKLEKKHYNDKSQLYAELENIRSSKKFSFYLNSGLIKLSTVHSFKGLESSTVIYLLMKDDEEEMAYTGITRAKNNLIVFLQNGNKYDVFFNTNIGVKKIDEVAGHA
jgi:hypothetical protein